MLLLRGDLIGHHSAVKTIQFNSAENVLVYPNPATNNISVNWSNGQIPATIIIVNSAGIAVYKTTITANKKTIDVTRFAAGHYIIIHSQGDVVKHIPFVKIK